MTHFPGITIWRIDQAGKHADTIGPGTVEERQNSARYCLSKEKMDHLLDFISCPHYL